LIGIVAPASAVNGKNLRAGVEVLERAGYRVRVGAGVRRRSGYLAGADNERVSDLHDMFRDPQVKAIMAARGGYGAGRLLPSLELDLARINTKIFLGHSDLTFLLNYLVQGAHLVVFHGPMVSTFAEQPEAVDNMLAMLTGQGSAGQQIAQEVVRPGTGEGSLIGGCLSVLVSMLGTPYAIDTRGCLLFLEDVNEKPYRIDRMLTQLRQAGALQHVAGVIFGEMHGCAGSAQESVSVRDVVFDFFGDAPYPVAYGLASGHGSGEHTLPLGVRARLAGDRLTMLESPLAEPSRP
jgi:muramoyltetrapeptide carboxypeptidase